MRHSIHSPSLISIEDLHKSFPMGDGRIPALRGVSAAISRGEYVAVSMTRWVKADLIRPWQPDSLFVLIPFNGM